MKTFSASSFLIETSNSSPLGTRALSIEDFFHRIRPSSERFSCRAALKQFSYCLSVFSGDLQISYLGGTYVEGNVVKFRCEARERHYMNWFIRGEQ